MSTEIINNDTRTLKAKFNLYPYNLQNNNSIFINKRINFRYLYTGREYNIETGNYYYRARIMNSTIGRFTSKDPILYLNLYRYVKNNPISYLDKFGASGGGDDSCDTLRNTIDRLQKTRKKVEKAHKEGKITDDQYDQLISSIDGILKKEVKKYNKECGQKYLFRYVLGSELERENSIILWIISGMAKAPYLKRFIWGFSGTQFLIHYYNPHYYYLVPYMMPMMII